MKWAGFAAICDDLVSKDVRQLSELERTKNN